MSRSDPSLDRTDLARRIRDELERVRASESAAHQALDEMRLSRVRLEALIRELAAGEADRVRAVVREELRAAGWPDPSSAGGAGAAGPRRWARPSGEAGGVEQARPSRAPAATSGDGAPATRGTGPRPPGEAATARPPAATGAAPSGATASGAAATEEARARPRAATALPAAAQQPGPPDHDEEPDAMDPPGTRRRSWQDRAGILATAVLATLAVLTVGWLGYRTLAGGPGVPILAVGDTGPGATGVDVPAGAGAEAAPEPAGPSAGPFELPTDPAERVVLYDSLWEARSPVFDPLLASLREASSDRDVLDAAGEWSGGDLSVQETDLLHSALVQLILRDEINPRVELDGVLLRNPCRGTSCSALLNLWQVGRERFGFPEVPEDAPVASDRLRQVEATLVLDRLARLARPSST